MTNIDSVTKFQEYITQAKECGMKALAFTEHGSIFEWFHKKTAVEAAGMKYIHGVEAYITESLETKVRDNFHCVLLAKNQQGFHELNALVSRSFWRDDNHFYYVPRISYEELMNTSENILITTACVGSILGKGERSLQDRFIRFLYENKHRCFLEIGHHPDQKQIEYNRKLWNISQNTGVPLIAGTDTHSLNATHSKGRSVLQKAKGVFFEGEEGWDLTFHSYEELVGIYESQGSLPQNVVLEAIEHTNVLAGMVEEFALDFNTKYPKIYEDPERMFREKVMTAMDTHPYAKEKHSREKMLEVVENELSVYSATQSVDFMLLQNYLREWEREQGILCGYGRGSVTGSFIAYLLRITEMDSIQFDLNFFRFMNPDRVTNADIDTDYGSRDRERVKEFLLKENMGLQNIQSAEIITFNTIQEKGAIRDVARALHIPLDEVSQITKQYDTGDGGEIAALRKKYSTLFEYVDIVSGTVVSIGSHPSGVLVSDLNIAETIGLCSTSGSSYPVSMLNMKELDDLMYVKLDILGLDNMGVINDTCEKLGIDRLTPDNTDMDDMEVWNSIREDTTLIFQWESDSARVYLQNFMSDHTLEKAQKNIPNFSMIKWLSFGNGLIRPACASFRNQVAEGEFYDNGFDALNQMLAPEAGRIAMQETIMRFLVEFCGYSPAESDSVRRAIAKKKGTEQLLPEIGARFIEYAPEHYEIDQAQCEEVIQPFLQIILDASDYGFSWNHSDAYSAIGYICGYLRHYHPLEFLTAALNTFEGKEEKTVAITKYALKRGIPVLLPRWGKSRAGYFFQVDEKGKGSIFKGIASVKFLNKEIAERLYELSQRETYSSFMKLLKDMSKETSLDARQLTILVRIDFFSQFGNQRELSAMVEMFSKFKKGEAKRILKSSVYNSPVEDIVKRHAVGTTKTGEDSKSYTLFDVEIILQEIEERILNANMIDTSDVLKVKHFMEVMGYMGYVTGKTEDRPKLYVSKVYPLKRKKDGKQFGYSFITKSLGSGKEARFTVFNRVYEQEPIQAGDIILCRGYEQEGIYFTMTAYQKLLG